MDNVEEFYPLSPAQEGMLFHSLMAPGTGVYTIQVQLPIASAVDLTVFEEAWTRVIHRHPILRTRFHWEELEQPVQIVQRTLSVPLQVGDWRGLEPSEWRRRLADLAAAERDGGFDLTQAPLMRLTLLRREDSRYLLVWTFHHLLLDGWSVQLVIQDMLAHYRALARHEEPRIRPSRPYRDYIAWIRKQRLDDAETFWRDALRGMTAPTPLGVDRPQIAVPDRGHEDLAPQEEVGLFLPDATTEGLAVLGRRHRLTMNTLLQAAVALLLSRYSGQRDVAYGVVSSGRPPDLAGAEAMVGVFVNTIMIRARWRSREPLLAWLRSFQRQLLEARRFEYTPLLEVHGWSEIPRNVPLFEILLSFASAADSITPRNADTAKVSPDASRRGPAKEGEERLQVTDRTHYPLTLEIATASRIFIEARYSTARFDASTIGRLLGHLGTLLESLVSHAQRSPEELPYLTSAERIQALTSWNATEATVPSLCAHQVFEQQAAARPAAVAAVCGDQAITYRELNLRANRLALHLIESSVEPGTAIAVLADRNLDFLVSMLAIFKVGGVYVPIDIQQPSARYGRALAGIRASLLLVQRYFLDDLAKSLAAFLKDLRPRFLTIEELLTDGRPGQEEENPESRATLQDVSYLIFTSGSTGIPKGVMVEHSGMLNHLWAKIVDLELDAGDCVAQTASQSFDISVWQFLAPLLVGGRVEIFPPDLMLESLEILQEVAQRRISVLETVPSMLRVMLEEADAELPVLPTLRWHLVTGEAMPPDLCRQWLARYERIPLVNAYGPTECSDDVTHYLIDKSPAVDVLQVPIGRPILNTRLYLLDQYLQPVAVGVSGELFVAGSGVGRGYLDAPRATALVFLPDCFDRAPGGRLYRTGDMARFRTNGALEFLGRQDHQVKLRGFRIELGEIEATLLMHPAIARAIVLATKDQAHRNRLVAYVVPTVGTEAESGALREYLRDRLPEYMVPAAFVSLQTLPLSPTGKLDRKALAERDPVWAVGDRRHIKPRNPTERRLAVIWEEILGVRDVGVNHDFFELGGHSLLAVVLMGKIRKQFGIRLPLATLIEAGTIMKLAKMLEESQERDSDAPPDSLVAIQALGSRPPFFAVHPIGGQVQCYVDLAGRLGPEQPFYGLQALGLEEVGETSPSIADMARSYVQAIRRVQPRGPYFLGGWSMGGIVAFEMARQLQGAGEAPPLVALFDVWSPEVYRIVPEDAYLLYELIKTRTREQQVEFTMSYDTLRLLGEEERLSLVVSEGHRSGILPAELGIAWLRRFLQGFKARRVALQSYHPESYAGTVVQFRAEEREGGDFLQVLRDHLGVDTEDPGLGWKQYAVGPEVHWVPGNHEWICREPNVKRLADLLRPYLDS